ncbi:MAG: FeoB-associated Cys-rich membrane protein [Eubacteriales bacterium]
MKLGDWILVGVIAALFVAAVIFLVRKKKRGGCIGCSACSSVKKKGSRTGCAGCHAGCTGCCDTCPSHTACGEKSPAERDAHSPLPAAKTEDEPQKDRPADSIKQSPEQSPEDPSSE